MLPGGPVCPVDPRNEQGVTRRHRPHELDDGSKQFGAPAAIRHRPEPRIGLRATRRRTGMGRRLTRP